jgi:hypothetical protein
VLVGVVVGAPVGPALGEVGEAELGPRDTVGAALATLGARVAGARVVAEEGTEEGAPEGPVVMVGDPLLGPPVLGTRAGPHVKGTAVGPTDTVGPRVAAEGAADEGAAVEGVVLGVALGEALVGTSVCPVVVGPSLTVGAAVALVPSSRPRPGQVWNRTTPVPSTKLPSNTTSP